jgi:anti-sigma B factor antagonist
VAPLGLSTDLDAGGLAVLSADGEIALDTADDLAIAIAAAVRSGLATGLIVDLGRVSFLDMAGLRVLIQGREVARRAGVSFRIIRPGGQVRRVLELTGTLPLLIQEPTPSALRPTVIRASTNILGDTPAENLAAHN